LRAIDRAGKAATVDLSSIERDVRAKLEEWKTPTIRAPSPQRRRTSVSLPWSNP
jgi:hypothetical protein